MMMMMTEVMVIRPQKGRRVRPLFIAMLALVCLMVCCGQVSALSVNMTNVTVGAGEDASLIVTLDAAPAGISQYNLTLSLVNDSVAEFTAVEFPEWVVSSENSTFPAPVVDLLAVNDSPSRDEMSGPLLLATVHVRGIAAGVSPVTLTIHQMEDGNGTVMDGEIMPAVVFVNESAEPLPVEDPPEEETVGGIADALNVSVQSPVLNVGREVQVNVTLSAAPAGLGRFNLSLVMENVSVAEWTGVAYPSGVLSPGGSWNASQIYLDGAYDLWNFTESADPIVLATVRVQGLTPGVSNVTIAINTMEDGNGTVMDVEGISGVISVNGSVADVPVEESPELLSPGDGEEGYQYICTVVGDISFGTFEEGTNEESVYFDIDTNDPHVTAVQITVCDTNLLTQGFFASDGHTLPLPLQVKGGDILDYQKLNCSGVVLTMPLSEDEYGDLFIDPITLNQPVPNLYCCLAGDYHIELSFDSEFI